MLQLLRSTSCVEVNFLFSSSLRDLFDISAGILHHFALGREQKSELIWPIQVYHGFEILSTSLVEVSSAQSLSTASYWSLGSPLLCKGFIIFPLASSWAFFASS